jgi:predicted phosphodiesterase
MVFERMSLAYNLRPDKALITGQSFDCLYYIFGTKGDGRVDWKERAKELIEDNIKAGLGKKYDNVAKQLNEELGVEISPEVIRYHIVKKKNLEAKSMVEERVLVLSDLHIPFHRPEEIMEIVEKHKNKIDTIIFAGDVVDCEAISVFDRVHKADLAREMIESYHFLRKIDKMTPNVKKILIWGNHEYRFIRYLASNGGELSSLMNQNILAEIVGGFTYTDWNAKISVDFEPLSSNFEVVDNWYVQYHDMIVAHPKNFSKIALRTATNTCDYFFALGVDFQAVLVGHTHKFGVTKHNTKYVSETGCLCQEMEYASSGNINYRPQEYGYVLAHFDEGIFNFDKSNFVNLRFDRG